MGAYYTPSTLAALWGVCPETVIKLIKTGKLRGFPSNPGGRKLHWLISPDAVIAFENKYSPAPPEPKPRTRRQREAAGVIEFFK